ncbi:uncharacterized protein J4E87_009289 [Alternaria ethzedia]|uniref:uncharacterized protein n=1 Tax=Alternaria ethzedia TaxID=181014 RepID=UPI0020C1BD73|nr:uncharacterized protein J4E87_009289 [Alternaria ethzedia]KAI4615395.1 hypothetical protein J4E87_009289 [Alternaria ethzedia]
MHIATTFLITLGALASLTLAGEGGAPDPNCGAPFCKRAQAMENIRASLLAKASATATVVPTIPAASAGADAHAEAK